MSFETAAFSHLKSLGWLMAVAVIIFVTGAISEDTLNGFPAFPAHLQNIGEGIMGAFFLSLLISVAVIYFFALPQAAQAVIVWATTNFFGPKGIYISLLFLPLFAALMWLMWYEFATSQIANFDLGINSGPEWQGPTVMYQGVTWESVKGTLVCQAVMAAFNLAYLKTQTATWSKKVVVGPVLFLALCAGVWLGHSMYLWQ